MSLQACREKAADLATALRQAEPEIGQDLAIKGILSLMALTAELNARDPALMARQRTSFVGVCVLATERKKLAANDRD